MDHSWGYASDPRLRDENQDCHGLFEFPDFTLAIVCDGMGGHVGGAHASAIAVRTIHDTLLHLDTSNIKAALEEALGRANQAIYEAARKNHRLMGMGTTVVAAAVTDDKAYLAHVGDSRGYLLRDGQVQQITRDHTMVNLFVDAELLTPEDAATHPEAHVLSRSLGVERTVDVELSDPVDLAADDVILLCSDGVHGVITDWELGNVDWGAPHEGVQHVMDIVAAREGDDNATAVAVLLATSFEDVPPTPVPDPNSLIEGGASEPAYASGVTAVPFDEPESGQTIIPDGFGEGDEYGAAPPLQTPRADLGPATPAPIQESNSDRPSYLIYDEPETEPGNLTPAAVPDLRKSKRTQEAAPDAEATAQGGQRRNILLAGIAVVVLGGVGLAGALAVGLSMGGGGGDVQPLEIAPADGPVVEVAPEAPVVDVATDTIEEDVSDLLFKPRIPEAPRRLPHRPLEYTQPPPGGPAQWEAVQAARTRNCADSLDAVKKGMKASIDHATLYSQAWFCYNETHQRPLMEAEAETWEEFRPLLVHFEGPDERREELPEDVRRLPRWYQPAVDGIEHRLESWQSSDNTNRFAPVMVDLLGEPTATDQLIRDVMLEVEAAVGLSRLDEPEERVVEWWARRVYVATRAMNGPIGRMIETHRPELMDPIRAKLEEATSERHANPDDPESEMVAVPELITQAYETAMGLRDKPDSTRPKSRGPAPIKEPDLDELDPGRGTVHRGSDLVTESPF